MPTSNTEGGWSFSLAEYIRHNDMPIYEASERVLRAFQDELMPAESLSEIFDVAGQYAYTADPLNKGHRFQVHLMWEMVEEYTESINKAF